jgi:hypothetical protein
MLTANPLETANPALARATAGSRGAGAQIHWLLTVQTVVIILLSVNRLSSLTLGYVAPNEFLRWVDLHNMLTLPLISLIAFYLLKRHLEAMQAPAAAQRHVGLGMAFAIGVYLFGAGYGAHEVTNYLHVRFCSETATAGAAGNLCPIVIFNDDDFSHWVWFAGFVLINASLLLLQAAVGQNGQLRTPDVALLMLNGLVVGMGIFANLAFEVIGLDLYVVALLAGLSVFLLWRLGRRPLFIYYATAYGLGLVATALYKLAG